MRKLMIAGILGALLIPIGTARADHDLNRKSPPKLRAIYKGEVVQRVSPWSYCWSWSTEEYSVAECSDGFQSYPEPAAIESPDRVILRIPYSAEPRRLRVTAYRKVKTEHGWDRPVGEGERLEYELKAHRVKGHVSAWDAVLTLDENDRHYYLDVYARLHQGDPSYAMHLQT